MPPLPRRVRIAGAIAFLGDHLGFFLSKHLNQRLGWWSHKVGQKLGSAIARRRPRSR